MTQKFAVGHMLKDGPRQAWSPVETLETEEAAQARAEALNEAEMAMVRSAPADDGPPRMPIYYFVRPDPYVPTS